MIHESIAQAALHIPSGDKHGFTGVVVPVGPAHDPVPSVLRSDKAAMNSEVDLIHLVVVNGAGAAERGEHALAGLHECLDRVAIVCIAADVGYIQAVRAGLELATSLGLRRDRIGFLDADAHLRSPTHWAAAIRALDREPDLDAISGLVVHDTCRIWETLSSSSFIAAMEAATGAPVNKPYLQGGAGGTLARWLPFANAVENALRLNTLIGPTLSATSIAAGRQVKATSALPCEHTPRRTMKEWTDSVSAYERSWRHLIDLLGADIEKPWREFLQQAEHALRDNPKLLVDVHYNGALRHDVVMRVHAERLMLRPGATR